jgi:hypothetical protein
MAYASRRFIRTALKQVIENEKATPGEKLKAAELLWKMRNLASSPSPGKFKPSRLQAGTKSPQNGIDQILNQIQQ